MTSSIMPPVPTSCMPSVQPGITWLSGNSIGSRRSYELSKTFPLSSQPW